MKSYFEQYDQVHEQKLSVSFEYPVYFGRGMLNPDNPLLMKVLNLKNENRRHRAIAYLDAGILDAIPDLPEQISSYFSHWSEQIELVCEPISIRSSDKMENGWEQVHRITSDINEHHLCRQSYCLVFGGGGLLDLVGLGAALAHRGLRLLRFPTTVLSQNDAGVGVKNAIDQYGAKNFIGTFAPPFAVLNDYDFIKVLGDRAWRDGISEAFKVALIKDRTFFEFLCKNAPRFKERNQVAMEQLIHRCAVLHLDHIANNGDPFEMGSARPLDFGHWSAHKLEVLSNYSVSHGQAVSIGVCLDSLYAAKLGHITSEDAENILQGLHNSGLPVWHELMESTNSDGEYEIFDGLDKFREHLGGNLCLTLPSPVGSRVEINEVDRKLMLEALKELKAWNTNSVKALAV